MRQHGYVMGAPGVLVDCIPPPSQSRVLLGWGRIEDAGAYHVDVLRTC